MPGLALTVDFTRPEFDMFCDRGQCLRGSIPSDNCMKGYRRDLCFEKYHEAREKELAKPRISIKATTRAADPKWQKLKSSVMIRDERKCQLAGLLTEDQWTIINGSFKHEFAMMMDLIDGAHIFPAGSYPEIKYEEWNVVIIGRFFHSRLDTLRHPVTGKDISSRERLQWLLYARDKIWYYL